MKHHVSDASFSKRLGRAYSNYSTRFLPKSRLAPKSTKNTTNNICAMDAAPEAIPPNPKIAAIIAIIKKVTDQFNIISKVWLIFELVMATNY